MNTRDAEYYSTLQEVNSRFLYLASYFIPKALSFKMSRYYKNKIVNDKAWLSDYAFFNKEILKIKNKIQSLSEKSDKDKENIDKWFSEVLLRYYFLSKNIKDDLFVIVDSGFIQMSSSIFLPCSNTLNSTLLAKYIDSLPPIDLLFYMKIDEKRCLSRLKSKGTHIRTSNKSDDETLNFIRQNIAFFDNFINVFKIYQKNSKIIEIDNTGDLPHSKLEVKRKIDSYLELRK
ncbi:hypothetical protein OAO35_03865 [Euryarchaeota archaeon]|nr:hypothetical protein [Euryarchaeota archaeon]